MSISSSMHTRSPRTAHAPEEIESTYLVYASLDSPSLKTTADLTGISHRTIERWCRDGNWVERRAKEQLDRVATVRRVIELKLLSAAEQLTDRAIGLALQSEDLPTAARMTVFGLGLLGHVPVTKSASVVQHLRDDASSSIREPRTVPDLVSAYQSRLAELLALGGEGGADRASDPSPHPGVGVVLPTPGDYEDEDEEEDGRGPTPRSASTFPSPGSSPQTRVSDPVSSEKSVVIDVSFGVADASTEE